MKDLWRFLYPYVCPYKGMLALAIFLSLVISLIKGAEVWLIKDIVNSLNPNSPSTMALKVAGILLLLGLINYPARFYHFYLTRYVVDKANCTLRSALYSKLQNLPLSFFNKEKAGNLTSHVFNDSNIFTQGIKSSIDLIREPLTALVMLGQAIYTDWQLTLVILLVAPLFVVIFVKSGKKVRAHQEIVQEQMGSMTHNINEGIAGQKTLKAFNLQSYVLKRFKQAQDQFFKYQMKTTAVEEHAHPLVEFVGSMAFAGVIVFAHYRIQAKGLTTGDFIKFVAALALLMDPLRKYGQANVRMNQALAAGKRIISLMQLQEEKDEGLIELKEFKDKIEIDNVSFSYGEGLAISQFSVTIPKGKRVAFVGLSGSGKSTLINLLLRLYPIQHGEIRIDGIPLQKYTLQSIRKIFGLVTQDIFLFHDTILENLAVGRPLKNEEIEKAIDVACAREFIKDLPQGINTIIGDRGTRLSGGQCQRLTIARAFLQNSPILLFDEATSALDNASEKLVQEALERLAGSKTVLAVAHRLSTIQNYDSIIVMRSGERVEEGTHQELMEAKGEYFKLYELGQRES